jgi:hypothetical protein
MPEDMKQLPKGPGWLKRSLVLWFLAGFVIPLTHTWLLDDGFFETSWGPLHVAWALCGGVALAFLGAREGCSRRLVVAWIALSYALTLCASFILRPLAAGGWALCFLGMEFAFLGSLVGWCGRLEKSAVAVKVDRGGAGRGLLFLGR